MDIIKIPASITFEKSLSIQSYKSKSSNKISNYRKNSKRAFIRFSSRNFANKVNKLKIKYRQIEINFLDNSTVSIRRTKYNCISMQAYSGTHPYIQIVTNSKLPLDLRLKLDSQEEKSKTFPVIVELNVGDWKDINLLPSDFLLDVEKDSKLLMNKAIKNGFKITEVSKGREFDLKLINRNKKELIIGLSSHVAKSQSRSKEKTIQKILMDIAKMLPYLDENKSTVPVIITRPIEFTNSWSFTTNKYLEFYRRKFGFIFLTTEFKNNWEDDIIKELSKV
jgi:hypothetical protein